MQTNVKIAIRKSESVKCKKCTEEAIKSKLLCTAATVAGIFTLQQAKIQGGDHGGDHGGGSEEGVEDGHEDDEYNHEKFSKMKMSTLSWRTDFKDFSVSFKKLIGSTALSSSSSSLPV